MGEVMEQPDTTAEALRMVLDRMAIEELLVRYYSGLGSGDPEGFGGFFADEMELDVNGIICRNKDEVAKLYRDVAEDKPNLTGTFRMLLTNLLIDVKGDTAHAQMLWTQTINDTVKAPPRFIEQGRGYSRAGEGAVERQEAGRQRRFQPAGHDGRDLRAALRLCAAPARPGLTDPGGCARVPPCKAALQRGPKRPFRLLNVSAPT